MIYKKKLLLELMLWIMFGVFNKLTRRDKAINKRIPISCAKVILERSKALVKQYLIIKVSQSTILLNE